MCIVILMLIYESVMDHPVLRANLLFGVLFRLNLVDDINLMFITSEIEDRFAVHRYQNMKMMMTLQRLGFNRETRRNLIYV